MATPVIDPITSPLTFIVDAPIDVSVRISNNPYHVELIGDLEEMYWTFENGMLFLRGTLTRTRRSREVTIYATDPDDSMNVVTREFTYDVINPPPVITEITTPVQIVRGVEQNIFVPIANNPAKVEVEGLLVGLDHRLGQKEIQMGGGQTETQQGVFIVGRVPISANFTRNFGRFWIYTENDGGNDNWGDASSGGLNWDLVTASLPSQVTGLSASVSGTTVTLTWTAPADGGTPLIRYEFQVDSSDWISTESTSTSVQITLASRTTAYSIKVRAVNGLGAGPASAAVSATLERLATAARSLTVRAGGTRQMILSWSHPTDRGVPRAVYDIYALFQLDGTPAPSAAQIANRLTTGITGTTFTESNIDLDFDRYYVVVARNSAGDSPRSNIASFLLPVGVTFLRVENTFRGPSRGDRGNELSVRCLWSSNSNPSSPILRYEMRYRLIEYVRSPPTSTDVQWLGGWSSWETYTQNTERSTGRVDGRWLDYWVGAAAEVRAVNAGGRGEVVRAYSDGISPSDFA